MKKKKKKSKYILFIFIFLVVRNEHRRVLNDDRNGHREYDDDIEFTDIAVVAN